MNQSIEDVAEEDHDLRVLRVALKRCRQAKSYFAKIRADSFAMLNAGCDCSALERAYRLLVKLRHKQPQ